MAKAQIVTLTMNPAVDIATDVDRIEPVHKLRCSEPRRDAGGGGINVARAVRRLGGDPVAIFPSGGAMGDLLEALVRKEALNFCRIAIAGETRQDIAVRETSTGKQYRFVMPGPALSDGEVQACLDKSSETAKPPAYLVASGSLPPNVSPSFYGTLAGIAARNGIFFVLDSSGAALKAALGKGLALLKPSRRELGDVLGVPLADRAACIRACRQIVDSGGAEIVALTLGEEGALLAGRNFTWSATAPRVDALSSVGAGDSFLGALVLGLANQLVPDAALRTAVAAGSAALLSEGTGLCDPSDVARLQSQVQVVDEG